MTPRAQTFLRNSAKLLQTQNAIYFRRLAHTRGKPILPDRGKRRLAR